MADLKAVIADDEEQLRRHLKLKLSSLWPELIVCGEAENGIEALALIETARPDIAFLDIKMPGLSGIEVAGQTTADCSVVFITAYDQYAVEAFDQNAVDYLLKPVTDERLIKAVKKLKNRFDAATASAPIKKETLERLLSTLKQKEAPGYLKWIRVRHGEEVRLISANDVYYFKAEDKYTVVKTLGGESLIRKSIQGLTEELDPDRFWRVHRGTIVNVSHIAAVSRSFAGRLTIQLKNLPETLTVSRSYTRLFKQM